MYRIFDRWTGEELPGSDETPFRRRNENGVWEPCGGREAEAVAVRGQGICQFLGGPDLEPDVFTHLDADGNEITGAREYRLVVVKKDDGAERLYEVGRDAEMHGGQIVDLETAVCGQALDAEDRFALLEQVICEMALAQEV